MHSHVAVTEFSITRRLKFVYIQNHQQMSFGTGALKGSGSGMFVFVLFDMPYFSCFLQLNVSSQELTSHGLFLTSQCSSMPPWAKRK